MEKVTEFETKKERPRINWNKAFKKAKIESVMDLSKRLDIAYPNAFKIVDKDWNPKWDNLVSICKKLKIKLSDLIDE